MSNGRKRLYILIGLSAAVAVMLLVATLAVAGDDDGDDESDETATASATSDASDTATATSTETSEETQTEEPTEEPDDGEGGTLQLVNDVAAMLEGGDYDGLMAMAVPQPLDCTPMEGSFPLCDGLSPDAEVQGFRIAIHGSHGMQEDEEGLRGLFEEAYGMGAERVSYGCAVDMPACDGLIVVFEVEPLQSPSGSRSRVFYIVLIGGDIVGAGKSGDNVADFLRDGTANSWLGATEITLLP